MPNLRSIPREIFDRILKGMLPNSIKNMDDAHLYCEKPENLLWRAIFKSDEWIGTPLEVKACPSLIGPTLDMIGKPDYRGPQRHYVLLSINDSDGDLRFFQDLLFQSLREGYCYDEAKFEITLLETTFTTPDKMPKMEIAETVLYII